MGLGSEIRKKTYYGSGNPGTKKAPDPGSGSATLLIPDVCPSNFISLSLSLSLALHLVYEMARHRKSSSSGRLNLIYGNLKENPINNFVSRDFVDHKINKR
jgi:hypothetical protein